MIVTKLRSQSITPQHALRKKSGSNAIQVYSDKLSGMPIEIPSIGMSVEGIMDGTLMKDDIIKVRMINPTHVPVSIFHYLLNVSMKLM